jgi:hypothetical protein
MAMTPASNASWSAKTWFTRPHYRASAAIMRRPV